MNNRISALILTIAVALAAPAFAEETISIEINKGQMIKLATPATSVVVADPNTADVQVVSPRLLFVHGKRVGDTSIYAIDSADNQIYSAIVTVTHNLSKLQLAIKRAAPNADVSVHTVDGGLVLDGSASTVEETENIRNIASAFVGEKEKMVNMIKSGGTDQVALKVRIVEMTRNDMKRFGINMQNMIAGPGGLALQLLQGTDIETDINQVLQDDVANPIELSHQGFIDRAGSKNTQIGISSKGGRVNNVIDALETNGLVNTLAEPTLTTTSGKPASFLAGGEFPIPVRSNDGSVTITYKPFGVGLNFTPVVLGKDRISIDVAPEVSSLSFDNPVEVDGIKNPIILTRKASSTVELGSGDTFMMAGLMKNDGSNSVDKFPGLGDLPVLGALFRSNSYQNNQTELVILVTPYLVRPVSDPKKMMLPSDGMKQPSDFDRLLTGDLYQQEPMKKEEDMPKLNGESGFKYDETK
jgi:pilus assembly protein CpaC